MEVIGLLHLQGDEIINRTSREFIISFAFSKMKYLAARYVFFPNEVNFTYF